MKFIGGSGDTSIPRFDVFLKEATPNESNPRIFWSHNSPSVTKKLSCDIESGLMVEHAIVGRSDSSLHVSQPTGRILDLMVKNVSKSDPLSRDEAEVLPILLLYTINRS